MVFCHHIHGATVIHYRAWLSTTIMNLKERGKKNNYAHLLKQLRLHKQYCVMFVQFEHLCLSQLILLCSLFNMWKCKQDQCLERRGEKGTRDSNARHFDANGCDGNWQAAIEKDSFSFMTPWGRWGEKKERRPKYSVLLLFLLFRCLTLPPSTSYKNKKGKHQQKWGTQHKVITLVFKTNYLLLCLYTHRQKVEEKKRSKRPSAARKFG